MPRKAKVTDTAEMAQIMPENSGLDGSEQAENAECDISVKSENSAEKQTKTRRSGTKKAEAGILDDTAQDATEPAAPKKKAPAQYKQRKPNQTVRQEAALEYIERNTKPRPARDKTKHLLTSDAQLNMEPGDNARYVMFGMAIYNMDPIDINNVQQVEQRIQDYFALCIQADMKPGVANLAMALGIERHRLLEVVNDAEGRSVVPSGVRSALKKAHAYMGSYWEQIMQNGKINPASGIFLGKNNFGYRDSVEHVVTPNIKTSDQIAPADLQRRIEALPDD